MIIIKSIVGDALGKVELVLGSILGNARSSISINPEGMNNDQLYCIANDWRSRDWKAKEFRTMTNCRFSQVTDTDTLQAIHL